MCETDFTFFDQTFFKDLISALIGTGTALWVFYLTIKKERKNTKKQEKKIHENRLRYFSNLSNSSKKHIGDTIQNISDNISEIEADNLKFHLLKSSTNNSLKRLGELIQNENYFLTYIEHFGKDKSKNFNNFCIEIDYFNLQIDQIWEMKRLTQQSDYERKVEFVNQANEIMNLTAYLTKQKNVLSTEDINDLNLIFKEFYENMTDETDLKYTYTAFVRRALETVLINNTDKPEIVEILPKFKNVSNLFNQILFQNSNHCENLKTISEVMKDSLEKFETDGKDILNYS